MIAEPKLPKTRSSWRDWYLVAVLTGFVGVCLGPSLIGLRTLLSVNSLTNYYPWIAVGGVQAAGHEACTGDTVDAVMPGIAHIRTELFAGHLASWQSLVAGGGPLAALPNLGLLDPLSLPYLFLPLWLAPAFVVLLSFVVAVGGTFLFLRRLELSRPASMLAGLVFATSGFMVMWTNWPQVRVAALIPALFWAVERLLQRTRAFDAVLIAVVVASMVFGGFPVVTGYAIYLATGYLLVRIFLVHRFELRAWLRTVGLAVSGLVVGVLLTMVQLLPFLHFYNQDDLSYRANQALSGLPFSGLLTLIAPNSYGLCVGSQPQFTGVDPVELVAYVGAAAVILAIAGAAFGLGRRSPTDRGPRGYFVAAIVVIVALGWGSTSFREVTAHLPIFADNFIGRIRSVLGFAVAALAAIGFDWTTTSGPPARSADHRRSHHRIWAVLVCAAAVAVGLDVLWQARRTSLSGGYWLELRHEVWIPLLLVVFTIGIVIASRIHPKGARVFAFIVLPLLVAGQGAQFFHAVLPGDSTKNFYPETGTHAFLAAHLGSDRYASSELTMYPATSLYYGLRTPTGHFFFEPQWVTLLTRVDPTVMKSPTFADFGPTLNETTIGHQPILDAMAVKYWVFPPSSLAGVARPLPATDGVLHLAKGSTSCTLPGQPLRGVTVKLAGDLVPSNPERGLTLHVTVRDGGRTLTSGRYIDGSIHSGATVSIPVAGESLAAGGQDTVTLSATGERGGVTLAAVGGSPACAAVSPTADGLRLVYSDPGSVIYQRLTALPRIRWASTSTVIPLAAQRVAALGSGVPNDEVVLTRAGPAGSGRTASVSVSVDSDDHIVADVSARGAGYLVVADAMQQQGWSVTVDGTPARMVAADHAMAAVYVKPGKHLIAFSYHAPGQATGAVISAFAFLIVLVVVGWEVRRRRRSHPVPAHRHHATPGDSRTSTPPAPPSIDGRSSTTLQGTDRNR
jgi:hypothetical protein